MSGPGGTLGSWSDDPPVFHLEHPPGQDLWHQVGNDRLTATAHADGRVVLYSSEAGLVRLGTGTWDWSAPDGRSIAAAGHADTRVTWEVGGATWTVRGDGWRVTRRVWAPFGTEPALRIDVAIAVSDPQLQGGTFSERWTLDPEPVVLGGLMSPFTPPPAHYPARRKASWVTAFAVAGASRHATLGMRRVLARSLRLRPVPPGPHASMAVVLEQAHRPRWLLECRPSWRAAVPGEVVVAPLAGTAATSRSRAKYAELVAVLPDDEVSEMSFVVGLPVAGDAHAFVQRQRTVVRADTDRRWAEVWDLHCGDPEVERETRWHAGMLRSAQAVDGCFGTSYVAQGSAYGFVHGLQGAPRDYAHFLVPLCLIDPVGARSMLLTMLQLQDPDGSLRYAHSGFGRATSTGIHTSPTDLPIALLWAATEYVWSTADTSVLGTRLPWRPGLPHDDPACSVARRLLLAWHHLRDGVGRGPHGLIRVGSGDWNDPLPAMAPNRRRFRALGESVYNSAFAVHVLPRAARLLAGADPGAAAEMVRWADSLRTAVESAWAGRWFLRAWDGSGGAIGSDRLFLDANAWCLVARIGTEDQRRELVAAIGELLDDPCPIGALSLDRPVDVRGGILAPGWDTNGGVWPVLTSVLTWGYALHDPTRARKLLRKQLLATHARTYPDLWPGIWSGPDCYNAPYATDPGGTFVQPATPMSEFPVMNAHAHAGPLFALLKVLGLETEPDGLAVRRRGPITRWTLDTALGRYSCA